MCSDTGVMLETLALDTLYSGQFTIWTQLTKPNYLQLSSTTNKLGGVFEQNFWPGGWEF